MVTPLYTPENVRCAFQLNWSYSLFWQEVCLDTSWLPQLREQNEAVGIRLLDHSFRTITCSQFLVSTLPAVAPVHIARGIKGRLQALVRDDRPGAFQRNYDLHSIGSTQRAKAEHYVAGQLVHHSAEDQPAIDRDRADLQVINPDVDLGRHRFSSHARYRCNLHVVLRFASRHRLRDFQQFERVRTVIRKTSERHGHLLSRVGLLDDHVHLILGFGLDQSPVDVVLPYMNNIAWVFGMQPVLRRTLFLGTVGEYDLGAIPRTGSAETLEPPT